jgi:hypothetical protein
MDQPAAHAAVSVGCGAPDAAKDGRGGQMKRKRAVLVCIALQFQVGELVRDTG